MLEAAAAATKRSPPGARLGGVAWSSVLRTTRSAGDAIRAGSGVDLARQRTVLDEAGGAARGHAAEQLMDLDPEQRNEGLAAGVRQVRAPALAADAEHAVLVDPDDGPDRGALGPLQPGEGVVEVGGAEALLGEQGPGLGAVGDRADSPVRLSKPLHVAHSALGAGPDR